MFGQNACCIRSGWLKQFLRRREMGSILVAVTGLMMRRSPPLNRSLGAVFRTRVPTNEVLHTGSFMSRLRNDRYCRWSFCRSTPSPSGIPVAGSRLPWRHQPLPRHPSRRGEVFRLGRIAPAPIGSSILYGPSVSPTAIGIGGPV